MLIVRRTETEPYFNVAAEEYVLKSLKDDCFMLWRNEPSVIVGKHQNTLAEIDYRFVRQNNIKVVRRISGGGTVFHDLGNVNFSFVMNGEQGTLIDFRKFTQPILEILKILGLEGTFGGRNDLLAGSMKFSGNAEHVYKNRVLHHGTILFDSKLTELDGVLRADEQAFTDKAIKSKRSQVTNIAPLLTQDLTIQGFMDKVVAYMGELYPDAVQVEFDRNDYEKIQELVDTKYSTWKWNFGYSPPYVMNKKLLFTDGHIRFTLEVKNGIIQQADLESDFIDREALDLTEEILKGIQHREEDLKMALNSSPIGHLFTSAVADLAEYLF